MDLLKEQPVEDVIGALLSSIHPPLRRLWTKADFLHLHATSGLVFLVGGPLWQLARVVDGFHGHADSLPFLASDSATSGILCLAGFLNALSAIPMARFSSNKILDISDLKGNGFSLGGTGLTAMCLWMAWWFSGSYPEALHALDGPLVGLFSLLCILTTINWELMVKRQFSTGDMEFSPGHGQEGAEAAAAATAPVAPRKRDRQDRKLNGVVSAEDTASQVAVKKWLYRIASWPNLTQIFFMSSISLGGTAWLTGVLDTYPCQDRLLFDYSFASALGYSLSMFGETLRDRRLLTLEQDFVVLLAGVLAPMGIVVLDTIAAGSAMQINPGLYWAMFGQIPY